MIKKNARIILQDTGVVIEDKGGIPLSKGEYMTMQDGSGVSIKYVVVDKTLTCRPEGEDWIVDIEYTLCRE